MKKPILWLAFGVLVPTIAFAQLASLTSLVGTVTDPSGKGVPEATVTAVNSGTADTYTTTTNTEGSYRIEFVRVGTYNLTVEHAGFQKLLKTGIIVNNNSTVRNDFTLAMGTVSQSITVEATAPVIKTDDAAISETIVAQQLANLPLNGRDPMKLATTAAGVLPGTKGTTGVPPGQGFIGAGTREIQNSMSLDGISIMNNLITNSPTRPMVESVQEVEVQTGTYSAQYGAYMGVHINMITKSGTNTPHGSVVEFVRNDALDARPFFLNPAAKKTALRQNQFGFELDGPVVLPKLYNGRDRTFFMGSFEGLRSKKQNVSIATVPTEQMWNGNFSQVSTPIKNPLVPGTVFTGNIIPETQLSSIARQLRKYYVLPNRAGLGDNLSTVTPFELNTDSTVNRVDHNIGPNARLLFRYQHQWESINSGASLPVNSGSVPVSTDNFTVGYTHTLSPALVNDLRFGRQHLNTNSLNSFYLNNDLSAGTSLGIPGFDADTRDKNPGLPDFNITGFTSLNNAGTNWFQDDKTWQASEQMSWIRGAHSIMAGAEFRKLITGRTAANSPRGVFNFTGQFSGYAPADFLLGIPQNLTTPLTEVPGLVAEWRDGFFLLDNWQVSRKLTINIGVRYELPTVPYSVKGYATLLNPEQTALIPSNPPQPGTKFNAPDHNNWAPRLGIAFRLTNKTVLRAGVGIYYNPNQTNSYTLMSTNPPFGLATTYTSAADTPTLSLPNPTGGTVKAVIPNIVTPAYNLPSASMNQWSFGIARELWKNSGLDLQYMGSHSLHLDRSFYNNTPLTPGAGAVAQRRPNQLFGQIRTIQNDMISNYQGLSVVVRQRLSHGMQFNANYTWSHTLDVTSDSNNGGVPMNPYNWRADYGNAPFDIRHRFIATYIYEIPFFRTQNRALRVAFGDWQFNGITTLQSGTPYTVLIGTDTANTSSQGTYRPNIVGPVSSNCGAGHLVNCIDVKAFAVPAFYSYGNAGRNILRGPHMFDTDFSIFKSFRLGERVRFTVRAEAFNIFNNPEFANPRATFGTSTFGSIASTSVDNRQLQFGGKFTF